MWSLGVLVGVPIAVVLVLIGLALILLAPVLKPDVPEPWAGGGVESMAWERKWFRLAGSILVLVTVVASAVFLYPYEAEYHRWEERTGTVAEVNKRLVGDGDDGMKEKFVVRYAEGGREYGCDDTRCAVVEPGDVLTLSCKRVWQYSGTDGWDCTFVRNQEGP